MTLILCTAPTFIQATPIDVVLPFFSRICCPQQCNSFNCCLGFLRTQGIVKQFEWKLAVPGSWGSCPLFERISPLVSTQWHQVGFINIWCVAQLSRWPLLVYDFFVLFFFFFKLINLFLYHYILSLILTLPLGWQLHWQNFWPQVFIV